MDELKLPEQLQGPWEHALILTYGVDVPFFENALWSQFGARCRNKIILADGRRYLESCAAYARGGLVRYLNQRYLVDGITTARAAHAKAILLTNPERGRLLVGSGNLGWQGYASGGELFTRYEYSGKEPEAVNAFLALRGLVDGLVARRYLGVPAIKRIQYLWEQTPWLFQSPQGDDWPVRHNLEQSFLSQLEEIVGEEPVEELWLLSPFYDRGATALERLLAAFDPGQATLLLQPSHTSADPMALQRVLDGFGARCQVRSFSRGSDSPYVHAKMVLLKTRTRAICLQGSPNLSQVAMLLHHPQGNVELANLLTGPRHLFDGLLRALDVESGAASIDSLDLSYQSSRPSIEDTPEEWYLTGGEWHDDRLYLRFHGVAPDLRGAFLVVANRPFTLDVSRRESHGLEMRLPAEAAGLLERPVPVVIQWDDHGTASTTNPIFVCNRAALDAALESPPEGKNLDRIGDLDLDDAEFEELLAELDAALVIDRRSVWSLAGRSAPAATDEDDDAPRLDYSDIDYDMLRQHPRLQQYVTGRATGQGYVRSRLQIILSSITDHFRGLLDVSTAMKVVEGEIAGLGGGQAESEEEREEEEEERQTRHRSHAQRSRRILKGFVQRYLRGIRSPDFRELAGFEVMAQNYVIFTYLLWRLFAKDWVEHEFVVDSILETWAFFWGHDSEQGYFAALDQEEQAQALRWVQGDQHADAVLLASLYYSARLVRLEHGVERRFALRDFWRAVIHRSPFELNVRVLENAWRIVAELFPYEPPLPGTITEELAQLAQFDTRDSFLRAVEERRGYPRGSCQFEKAKVYREPLGRPDDVDCLALRVDDGLLSKDVAVSLLQTWMRFEDLDYYRIRTNTSNRILFYEGLEQEGLYYARDLDEEAAVGPVEREVLEWDLALARLEKLAAELEEGLVLAVRKPSPASRDVVES